MHLYPTEAEIEAYQQAARRRLLEAVFRFSYYHVDATREQALSSTLSAAIVLGVAVSEPELDAFARWALVQAERGSSQAIREAMARGES